LKIKTQEYGESYEIAATMNNLALCLKNLKKFEEAEKYYKKTMELMISVFGEDHSEVQVLKGNIANFYQATGQKEKAHELIKDAIDKGDSDENIKAQLLLNMGESLYNKHDIEGAIKNFKDALEIRERLSTKKETDNDIAKINTSLAKAYIEKKDFETAISLLKSSLEIIKFNYGEKHPNYINALTSLANTYFRQNKLKDAEKLFKEIIKEKLELNDDENSMVAIYQNYSVVLMQIGNFKESEEYFNKVLSTLEKQEENSEKHSKIKSCMNSIASCQIKQGDLKIQEALETYSKIDKFYAKLKETETV
jgi:pentatricopeptide repeat protein